MQKILLTLIGIAILAIGGYLFYMNDEPLSEPKIKTISQEPMSKAVETSPSVKSETTSQKPEKTLTKPQATTHKESHKPKKVNHPGKNVQSDDLSTLQTTYEPPVKPEYTLEEVENMNISDEEKEILITNIAMYESYKSRNEPIAIPKEDDLKMLEQ